MQGMLAVAAGGVVGALLRYGVAILATRLFGPGFPAGTLIVNVLGSFAMGVLVELMALAWSASAAWRLFLAVGLLGSFTTFSTFSLDVVSLYERRDLLALALYLAGSMILSIAALIAGLHFVRRLLGPTLG
jgi:CrcB protein